MFESIYVGMTGLNAFSRNLTVIGNNVSNINTPGFKSSELSFSDLVYNNLIASGSGGAGSEQQIGSGVGTSGTRVLFKQGTLQQTGNATDMAVDGNGLFVLRSSGKTTYTRDGQFVFDADGFLVSRGTGARVAAFDGGSLGDLSTASLRAIPGQATSTVKFVDNLDIGGTTDTVNVNVFDASGGSDPLTVIFTNNNSAQAGSWLLEVRDKTGATISKGEIRFNGDGSPADGFNTFSFTLNSSGASPAQVTFDFGAVGGFSGATNFSSQGSTLKVSSQDGFASGALTSVTFGADGVLTANYSNGQSRQAQRIALAFFESPENLKLNGNGTFDNPTNETVTLGNPNSGPFGALAPQSLESANVDLSQEFDDLIISQRGFQASSEVVNATNDMIQQLLNIQQKQP
jgi:flagellar hook protein FlgE